MKMTQHAHSFLFVFCSNYDCNLHRLRDIPRLMVCKR